MSARSSPGPRATATPILEERTSIDTLADRLGLIDIQEKPKRKQAAKPRRDNTGPQTAPATKPEKTKPKKTRTLSCCFCFSIPLEEADEKPAPARPQPRPVQPQQSAAVPSPRRSKQSISQTAASPNHLSASNASSARRSRASRTSNASQTAQLKDLIPDTVDMATASALMAELARPYNESDVGGYIYIYWMTPESED
jgi:hypothetical protein